MAIDLRGRSSVSFYDTYAEFPLIGSDIVLYVDRDTLTMYLWNGTAYELFNSGGGGSTITPVANYDALPDPTTVPNEFYWCSNPQGTYWLPGSLGGTYRPSGLYYSNAVSWEYTPTPYNASQAVVDAGTNDDQFVTPKTLETKPLAVSRTGTSISFDKIAVYNSSASPATGNITNDLTGARIGVVQKIYHNNSVAPTFPAGWVKIEGDYVISIENIIFAEWISGTRVEYWVVNSASSGYVISNAPITGATKTKITYDSKGLVTVGTDATTADIADSSNKRYQTDAQQTNFTNPKITVECIDALTVDFYAMYTFQIDSVTAITNSPTTTILVNNSAYTFGVSIATGAKITVTLNTAGVVNLNTTRL